MRGDDTLNIMEVFTRYMSERHLHIKDEDVDQEAMQFLRKSITGNSIGSRKWVLKAEKLQFWRHYKMRKTYVSGRFEVGKRDYSFKFSACNYILTSRGRVYCLLHPEEHRLYFFSGHFFDRLTQRHDKSEAEGIQREKAIQEGISFFVNGFEMADRDPLLLDNDGAVYCMIEGGYAVGNHTTIRIDRSLFPKNENGELTICFFKTFMSDTEISPERMERMVHLYRRNGATGLQKTS